MTSQNLPDEVALPSASPPTKGKSVKTPGGDGSAGKAGLDDAKIVERCLAGDERAWEKLYRRWHPRLHKAIEFMLGADAQDVHTIEEISARVWYAVLRNNKRLLATYTPERDSGFDAFLMGLARIEMMRYKRSERRRQSHEFVKGRRKLAEGDVSDWQLTTMMGEFASTLTPSERDFFERFLTAPAETEEPPDVVDLSASNVWQRRRRIRMKLEGFLRDL